MRRMLLGLAFGLGYVSLASAQQVDFDRLFMAASGSSLPEPPAQPADPNAAPELTPAPAGKPDEGLLPKPQGAGTSQVPSLQAPSLQAPSLQAPALQPAEMGPTRQIPPPSENLDQLTPAPSLAPPLQAPSYGSGAAPLHYEPAAQPIPQASPQNLGRVDFGSLFNACEAEEPMPTTRGYSYVSAPAANPPLHSCLAGIGARLNGHGCNQCGPNYACTPAQPVCYPGHAGVPCTYDGPILGVSRSGFTDYYRCSPCYRRLWENYGAERQRCCIENHGHLRGDCGCSNGCGYALPCGQAGACGQPGCGCGQAAAPAADCGCQNPHAANARGANPQATAPATR